MDSAKLHDLEHIQNERVEYTETVFIPYENVNKVRYNMLYDNCKVLFLGNCFLTESKSVRSWINNVCFTAYNIDINELKTAIYKNTSLPDSDKFIDFIIQNRHKEGQNIAYVHFLKEAFAGCDYGERNGKPTQYFIDGINITGLLETDRAIPLPYGVYEITVLGYQYHVRKGMVNTEGYKCSNKLRIILNKEYSKVSIKVGRPIDSREGRHISVISK